MKTKKSTKSKSRMIKVQPMKSKALKRMEMGAKTKIKKVTKMKISKTLKLTRVRKKENIATWTTAQTKIMAIKMLKTMA